MTTEKFDRRRELNKQTREFIKTQPYEVQQDGLFDEVEEESEEEMIRRFEEQEQQ